MTLGPPSPAAAGLIAVLLVAAALTGPAGGCGYRMEGQGLPGNARSLGLGQINNLTFTGELDVRLRSELRRVLLRNPAFSLTSPEASELVMEINLTRLTVTRPLDVSDTDLSSLRYQLRGTMLLFRREPVKRRILRTRLVARVRLDFDRAVMETPAVRDEIGEDVIIAFAELVEKALYRHF